METTRLSSKGQVIIPKAVRNANQWEEGLEFSVIDTGDGVLLKPRTAFPHAVLTDVAGMLKHKVKARTDEQIRAALKTEAKRKWRGSN